MSERQKNNEQFKATFEWADLGAYARELIDKSKEELKHRQGVAPRFLSAYGHDDEHSTTDPHGYHFQETKEGFFIRATNLRKPGVEEGLYSMVSLSKLLGTSLFDGRYAQYVLEATGMPETSEDEFSMHLYVGERMMALEGIESMISRETGMLLPSGIESTSGQTHNVKNIVDEILRKTLNS